MALIQYSLVLTAFVGLVFIAQGSSAFRCFICDSATSNCSSTPSDAFLKDCSTWCSDNKGYIPEKTGTKADGSSFKAPSVPCPDNFNVCRKIKQGSTTQDLNGGAEDDRVIRTCGYLGSNDTQKAYDYRSSENSKSEVFSCFKDGCNSAESVRFSVVGVVLSLVFFRLLN